MRDNIIDIMKGQMVYQVFKRVEEIVSRHTHSRNFDRRIEYTTVTTFSIKPYKICNIHDYILFSYGMYGNVGESEAAYVLVQILLRSFKKSTKILKTYGNRPSSSSKPKFRWFTTFLFLLREKNKNKNVPNLPEIGVLN